MSKFLRMIFIFFAFLSFLGGFILSFTVDAFSLKVIYIISGIISSPFWLFLREVLFQLSRITKSMENLLNEIEQLKPKSSVSVQDVIDVKGSIEIIAKMLAEIKNSLKTRKGGED